MISILLFVIKVIAWYITNSATAQSSRSPVTPFRQGSITVNPGVGLGTHYNNEFSGDAAVGTKVALEFGIWNAGPGVISLGPEVGATTSNRNNRFNDFRSTTFVLAGRSAWHFGWRVPGLDTYAGASAGVAFHNYRYNNGSKYNENEVSPVLGAFVGASYFFTNKFGVNAEAGFDITAIQAGVIFKLR